MLDFAICEHSNTINTCVDKYNDECFLFCTLHGLNSILMSIHILFTRPCLCKHNPKYALHLLDNSCGMT